MFKVSFKDNFKEVQTFNDRCTIVTLIGQLKMPNEVWEIIPSSITDWMWHHPSVDTTWNSPGNIRLEVSGKSVCSEEDIYSAVLGDRIAESKAKIRLYKFMHTFIRKIMAHHAEILYGIKPEDGAMSTTPSTSLYSNKDCLKEAANKYTKLWITESKHLGDLYSQTHE